MSFSSKYSCIENEHIDASVSWIIVASGYMACYLFGTEPSPDTKLVYYQSDRKKLTSIEFEWT